MPTYAVRAPLVRWLARAVGRGLPGDRARIASSTSAAARSRTSRCSRPHAASYVGVDPVDNPRAELDGPPWKTFPSTTRSFDVVLCNQVLEHCDDPVKAVSRAASRHRAGWPRARRRPTASCPTTRHPTDYWRWTHAGLEKLFADERQLGVG